MNIKTEGSKATLEFEVTDELREGLRDFTDTQDLARPPLQHEVGIVAALAGNLLENELARFYSRLVYKYKATTEVILTWDA